MVAAVVLDKTGLDLNRKVPVEQAYRDYVTEHHAGTADLQTGDRPSVRQLLYAALLPSGADATYALADTFKGVIGIKTGTTAKAGECLVFAAERNGKILTGTVLNSEDRYGDAAKLLDHGFGTDEARDMKIRELPSGAVSV